MKKLYAPLVLASASPRRKSLLHEAGFEFTVITAYIDEDAYRNVTNNPVQYTEFLAEEKAKIVSERNPNAIVIGSDTVVYADGEIVGKAKDDAHARQIIRKLFCQPHDVITGIAILKSDEGLRIIESVTTRVFPHMMSEDQIEEHIRHGDWQGKAGAYGIQDSDTFIDHIEGSFTNVMGFPMERVAELLNQFEIS
jgi:septum formation protein